MADETVSISLQADIKHLKAELGKLEGISAKEARAMVQAMSKEYRKAERAATKMTKSVQRDMGKVADTAKGAAERTASLLGGTFGDISDSVLDLGERFADLSGSIGGLGGVATGAAGGVAAMTFAMGFAAKATMEWLDGAEELRASLEEVSGLPPLSPAHAAALDAYAEASRDADAAGAQLSLTLMGQLAPAFTELRHTTVGAASAFSELLSGLEEVRHGGGMLEAMLDTWDQGMYRVASVVTLGAVPALHALRTAGAEAAAEIEHLTDETLEWEGATKQTADEIAAMASLLGYDTTPAVVDLDAAQRAAEASARDLAAAEAAAKREAYDYAAGITAATRQLDAMVAAEQAAADKAAGEWTAGLQGVRDSWAGIAEQADEAAAAMDPMGEMLEAMTAQLADAGALMGPLTSMTSDMADLQLQALEDQIEARKRLFSAGIDERNQQREKLAAQLEAGKISEDMYKAKMAALKAEGQAARAENRKTRKEEERAVKKAFAAKQAAAVADAIMQAAVNAVTLTASLAYLGFGAPLAATGLAMGQLGIQLTAIKRQKAPEFPMGGLVTSPDHVLVGAQPGEGFLTRQGVSGVGGEEGLQALNQGRASMGNMTANLVLDGRVLGSIVAETVRSSGAVGSALDQRTGTLPGIRS